MSTNLSLSNILNNFVNCIGLFNKLTARCQLKNLTSNAIFIIANLSNNGLIYRFNWSLNFFFSHKKLHRSRDEITNERHNKNCPERINSWFAVNVLMNQILFDVLKIKSQFAIGIMFVNTHAFSSNFNWKCLFLKIKILGIHPVQFERK